MEGTKLAQTARWESDGKELIIHVPEHFSFMQNINYLSRSPLECLYKIAEQTITRAVRILDEPVLIEVFGGPTNSIHVRLLNDDRSFSPQMQAEIARYVIEWFDVERDMLPFYEMAGQDELLQQVVQKYYGLRVMGIPELFEALAWGILGQQINLTFAYTLKRRLVEKYGESIVHEGTAYWLFPKPDIIAKLSVEDMDGMQLSVKKREYLIHVAQLIVSGELSKLRLLEAEDSSQAERMLTWIRGIGPWTANYVLMRCLRIPSAFPVDDVGLHLALKAVLGLERKPTKKEILELSPALAGWEAYVVFYLWRVSY